MGVRQFSAFVSADTTLVTNAETVVATLTGVSTAQAGQTVQLEGTYQITTGGSTTNVTTRIRRDSVSGTVVGEGNAENVSAAAGSTESHTLAAEEVNPGEFSGRTYVLTAQQTGAAANGSVLQAELVATITP